MNALKRFIKWCIDNDLAFTNISEAVDTFRKVESNEEKKELYPYP